MTEMEIKAIINKYRIRAIGLLDYCPFLVSLELFVIIF